MNLTVEPRLSNYIPLCEIGTIRKICTSPWKFRVGRDQLNVKESKKI